MIEVRSPTSPVPALRPDGRRRPTARGSRAQDEDGPEVITADVAGDLAPDAEPSCELRWSVPRVVDVTAGFGRAAGALVPRFLLVDVGGATIDGITPVDWHLCGGGG
jgi:hypothetical protein